MSSQKVICLVHGAWHQPLHYSGLTSPLQQEGYIVLSPVLASTGADPAKITGKSLHDDASVVLEEIEPYMKEGHEIVVVCHSYGALVGTEAALGQSIAERKARGLKGGVGGIIFISAILFPEVGMSSWSILFGNGNSIPPWITMHDTYSEVNQPMIFYADVDRTTADRCAAALVKQSLASVKSVTRHTASQVQAKKVFIACRQAQNNPLEAQLAMAEAAGAEVVILDCGHSPFLVDSGIAGLLKIIKRV